MNQKEPYPNHYNDEISLVDLAKTFVKRRRAFYLVFSLCVLAGFTYAFFVDEEYGYQSLVQLANDSEGDPLAEPKGVIAVLENRWVPEFESKIRLERERKLPFEFSFSNPEDTSLVKIVTESSTDNAELVKQAHEAMLENVMNRQAYLVSQRENTLKSQLASVEKIIDVLQGVSDSGPALAEAISSKSNLESELKGLSPAEILVAGRQGSDSVGPSKILIVLLMTFFGVVAGVFMAFFSEFVSLVRDQLRESDN